MDNFLLVKQRKDVRMAEKTPAEIWSEAIDSVEQGLGQNNMLLRQTRAESLSNGVLTVTVQSVFVKDYIEGEYLKQLRNALRNITRENIEIVFKIRPESDQSQADDYGDSKSQANEFPSYLNPRYTFDNFVVGASNRFAYTAGLAVAESPAKIYNPLFIYGGVGLGKTHLMQAIGNSIKENNSNLKVLYTTSEEFTNDMIESLRRGTPMPQFRNKYRSVDVLLIDDIQFIRGKEGTQEEFFYTFNALYNSQKQIVLTSDSHPKDIPALEERLRSRFEWGLITVIEPPELETRIAILRKKSEELGISHLPDEVAMYIADRVTSNIRELEGSLTRALALADLDDVPLSLEIVKEALKDIVPKESEEYKEIITVDSIQKVVAKHFNIRVSDLRSKRRTKSLTLPRHLAMYLCRRLTKLSLIDIGRDFGKKDHTTVIHACSKIEEEMQKDPQLRRDVEEIIEEVKSQSKSANT